LAFQFSQLFPETLHTIALTMQKIALVLLCFAFPGHGRRVQDANAASDADLNALASLLAQANSPSAAFQVANPGALRAPTLAKGQNVLSRRMQVPSMSDEAEPPSGEETPDLEKLSPSITEDLLDSLFGEDSLMSKAGEGQEEEAGPATEEEDDETLSEKEEAYYDAMLDEAKLLEAGSSGDFQKGYDELWEKEKLAWGKEQVVLIEKEKARNRMRRERAGQTEDFDEGKSPLETSYEEGPEKLTFIPSMLKHLELQAFRRKWRLNDQDTGSIQLQIATMTKKIELLTGHLQANRGDQSSLRGLQAYVNRRRNLLVYLLRTNRKEFDRITAGLGIRTQKLTLPKLQGARGIQQLARLEGTLKKRLSPKDIARMKKEKQQELKDQLTVGRKELKERAAAKALAENEEFRKMRAEKEARRKAAGGDP